MRLNLTLLSLLLGSLVYGQNLVENGSFENTGDCPITSNAWEDFVAPWQYFYGEPDFFHPCGFNGSNSTTNNSLPFDGAGFTGINVYGDTGTADYLRDYLHGSLSEPLDSGKFYRISFYVKPLNYDLGNYSYGVSNIGLYLSDTIIDSIPTDNVLDAFEPQVVERRPITETNYWTSVCGIYKAKGGERYITIGNFEIDEETDVTPLENATDPRYGYVMVDYVEVLENDFPQLPADTILCEGDRIDLEIDRPGFNVEWQDESTDNTFIVTEPGTYSATISNNYCSYVDSITIDGVFCESCVVYAANAFTPNGDGRNEEFKVTPACKSEGELMSFNIKIFDRWGQKVFESNSPEVSWDGRNVDRAGTYTYTIEYKYSNELEVKTEIIRGFVHLIL